MRKICKILPRTFIARHRFEKRFPIFEKGFYPTKLTLRFLESRPAAMRLHTKEELRHTWWAKIGARATFLNQALSTSYRQFLKGQVPRVARPYRRGTERDATFRGRLVDTQVAEVGRHDSGAVKPDQKRGPKFPAPYSGYSLRQHPRLIPIKRVLQNARLGRCLSREDQVYVQTVR